MASFSPVNALLEHCRYIDVLPLYRGGEETSKLKADLFGQSQYQVLLNGGNRIIIPRELKNIFALYFGLHLGHVCTYH